MKYDGLRVVEPIACRMNVLMAACQASLGVFAATGRVPALQVWPVHVELQCLHPRPKPGRPVCTGHMPCHPSQRYREFTFKG